MSSAETAYLFRHALLRDAAYQLQLPGDRARLHGLAFEVIEALAGGRPPEPPALIRLEDRRVLTHPTDPYAQALAEHARLAGSRADLGVAGKEWDVTRDLRRLYLRRAAEYLAGQFHHEEARCMWLQYAELVSGGEKAESLRKAALVMDLTGRLADQESLLREACSIHRDAGHRLQEG
ncbi:MAG: hypothetical protein FD180_1697 [Planctomycetota bacterium]|nr:MAG: hypothetical protein FD180_1697 [Planctomycetota bacterium]